MPTGRTRSPSRSLSKSSGTCLGGALPRQATVTSITAYSMGFSQALRPVNSGQASSPNRARAWQVRERVLLGSTGRADLDHLWHKATWLGAFDAAAAADAGVHAAYGDGSCIESANRLTKCESHWNSVRPRSEDARFY